MTLDVMDFISRHMISSVQNFRFLGGLEASNSLTGVGSLIVSSASSKGSWMTFLIPECILNDFGRQE